MTNGLSMADIQVLSTIIQSLADRMRAKQLQVRGPIPDGVNGRPVTTLEMFCSRSRQGLRVRVEAWQDTGDTSVRLVRGKTGTALWEWTSTGALTQAALDQAAIDAYNMAYGIKKEGMTPKEATPKMKHKAEHNQIVGLPDTVIEDVVLAMKQRGWASIGVTMSLRRKNTRAYQFIKNGVIVDIDHTFTRGSGRVAVIKGGAEVATFRFPTWEEVVSSAIQ